MHTALSLSVVILAKNEEKHIGDCLSSVAGLGGETVVVDSGSTDRTLDICRQHGATVHVHPFVNFSTQRNAALDVARGEWVFFVDADERCTAELAAEIRSAIERLADDGGAAAYAIPRRNYFFGRLVAHAGWSPDYQIRLLRRQVCRYDEARAVHEFPLVPGEVVRLSHPLTHLNYDKLGEFLAKQEAYALKEAQTLRASGARAKPHNFILQPLREFRRRYFALQGYRDGFLGIGLCSLMAWYTLRTYVYLKRLERL